MWAAGCVFGEMLLHQPLFAGKDGIDQLFKIMEAEASCRGGVLKSHVEQNVI